MQRADPERGGLRTQTRDGRPTLTGSGRRTTMMKAIAVPALAALLFVPATAHAQESLGGWRGLNVSSLDTVYVTDDAGRRTEGKLLRLDADSLVMLVDGAKQRFDAERVRRIDRRGDSLKNGAWIGAALGVLFGSIAAGISDCPGDDPGGNCAGFRIGTFAGALGIYTAIGVGVDALIPGRTRIFDAGRSTAAMSNLSGPQLAFRIRW